MDVNNKERKKIILSGGGSGGPVIPLLEIAKELRKKDSNLDFIFVGTESGPEKKMVADFPGITFISLPAGKLRRYFSIKNVIDIFYIILAFFKSFSLLKKERPDIIISVGSFSSVPLAYAAFFLRIPILIHQQDVRAGLANRLMAPLAKTITAVFEKTLADYGPRAILTGNPFSLPDSELEFDEALNTFFNGDKPLVLVLGGGTGAVAINELLAESKEKLVNFCNVIHLSGENKNIETKALDGYLSFEFLSHDRLLAIMKKADLVVSRCGLSTLTEISALRKASILIPMPASHQEDNAEIFVKNGAALLLEQKNLKADVFVEKVSNLLKNKEALLNYADNAYKVIKKGASEKIANIVLEIIRPEKHE